MSMSASASASAPVSRLRLFAQSLAFLALLLCGSPAALAQEMAATPSVRVKLDAPMNRIRSVDVQRILQDSLAAKSAQSQLENLRETYRLSISQQESLLREAEQKLQQERANLKPNEYAIREETLRSKIRSLEQVVQSRRRNLENAFTEAMGEVRTVLLQMVAEYAKQHALDAVLVKQQILWQNEDLDITPEILAMMNKALPDISIEPEASPVSSPAASPAASPAEMSPTKPGAAGAVPSGGMPTKTDRPDQLEILPNLDKSR